MSSQIICSWSICPWSPNQIKTTLLQNYSPISVINNDLKIFGCLLADRLSTIIASLISPDQMGFIPTRQISDNFWLTSNIIQASDFFPVKFYYWVLIFIRLLIAFSGPISNLSSQNSAFRELLCMASELYIIIHIPKQNFLAVIQTTSPRAE